MWGSMCILHFKVLYAWDFIIIITLVFMYMNKENICSCCFISLEIPMDLCCISPIDFRVKIMSTIRLSGELWYAFPEHFVYDIFVTIYKHRTQFIITKKSNITCIRQGEYGLHSGKVQTSNFRETTAKVTLFLKKYTKY